ncbi:4-hydroxybenzoate octaprenyltransferase [Asticcacaulis sp. AC402]|uniref:4-hydroxybenzoate octaprenyltransferase n=1 Tax=Asticcacaulis sp. AC402 TaxID=1282361 RepID=UPI0003C3C0AB|nr:4-hydroxybenzoate octaprenyltransferase [Asticcacaulis sp. AC402]ESQ73826.1 4-hydroxybenzoate polyprenyltransferase [Asticcacaulis sp. AC402]
MSDAADHLPDAAARNWVDRYAPPALRPWLRLGRFDRPIGIWLLFLPGAMGLAFATQRLELFPWYKLLLFALGAALMRAAGCAYNDFVDRDIDAQVERTRGRPIPSGQIKPKQALLFVAVNSLISLGILLQLGTLAIILGFVSLGLVAAYPFMKRITWWPQAWLGITFNWGFPMAVAAVAGEVPVAAWLFYAGLIAWTIGYDTIYALQDIEDDAFVGVKSSARALGGHAKTGISLFYGLAVVLTATGAWLSGAQPLFFVGLCAVTGHLGLQVVQLRLKDNDLALRLFRSNRTTGLLWVASLVLAQVVLR